MKLFLTLIAILCFLIGAAVVYLWSGSYNIAASASHWKATAWFLSEVRDQSIAAHSRGIQVPSLKDPMLTEIGFRNYHGMCRLCHETPGFPRTEIAKGLNPGPPDLASQIVQRRNDAELYWITKNGIKMTGMPAFGPTHTGEELWGIVTFLRRLRDLKPAEYQAMVKSSGLHEREEGHHHGRK